MLFEFVTFGTSKSILGKSAVIGRFNPEPVMLRGDVPQTLNSFLFHFDSTGAGTAPDALCSIRSGLKLVPIGATPAITKRRIVILLRKTGAVMLSGYFSK